jgi:hypothetical protein
MSYNLTHFLLSQGIPELEAMDIEPKYTFHAFEGNQVIDLRKYP